MFNTPHSYSFFKPFSAAAFPRQRTFLVLNLLLDILNRIRATLGRMAYIRPNAAAGLLPSLYTPLDLKGDGLASKGLDKDLHCGLLDG